MKVKSNYTVEDLNKLSKNTLIANLQIEVTMIGEDFILGKMPVGERTVQPFGLLHGGASVALAETLGSYGSACFIDLDKQFPVGLEINANHLRSARDGYVYATAKILHLGRKTHVWDIRIENENKELVCVSRLTVALLDKKEKGGVN